MAAKRDGEAKRPISLESALAGILALLIEERETRIREDKSAPRTEFLLARAGVGLDEIALVTGRTYAAVQKAVSRARAKDKDLEGS